MTKLEMEMLACEFEQLRKRWNKGTLPYEIVGGAISVMPRGESELVKPETVSMYPPGTELQGAMLLISSGLELLYCHLSAAQLTRPGEDVADDS